MPSETVLRELPGVDTALAHPSIRTLVKQWNRSLITWAIRQVLENLRSEIISGRKPDCSLDTVVDRTREQVAWLTEPSLRPVINATGVVLHTNLGRAPLGREVVEAVATIGQGYCNLEFDLDTARRGRRGSHISGILRYLTGAEDAVVVNNNAAALILALNTLAEGREVIISRGELIEIGGAFRLPDIMAASGAVMVEVGTTNRTRLADYQKAFTSNTGAVLKAHQSNYSISGFTEEASIAELAKWSRTRGVPFIYDIGSGLLRKPEGVALEKEPDVAGAIAEGADLVTFSCDKLLGGPQAGVMVGRKELVQQLAKAPLMRALRVGKLTLAALGAACRHYLSNTTLQANPAFAMLEQTPGQLDSRASRLAELLARRGIDTEIVDSAARCGGGTLPDIEIPSRAVAIIAPRKSVREREAFARRAYHHLLRTARPILGVLREGQLLFDLFTISDSDLEWIAESIAESISTKENR